MDAVKRSTNSEAGPCKIMDFKNPQKKLKEGSSQNILHTIPKNCDQKDTSDKTAAKTALENFLILKEIFQNLCPVDLRSCCAVNKTWRSIGDSMISDYQLCLTKLDEVNVKITKGFIDPQIERRKSTIAAETEYLQSLKGRRASFIEIEWAPYTRIWFCALNERYIRSHREFFTEFGPMTYKLTYKGKDCCRLFFSHGFNLDYNFNAVMVHSGNFKNLEYLRLVDSKICFCYADEFVWPDELLSNDVQLKNLKEFYFVQHAAETKYNSVAASKILQLMPNAKIYGVPFTFVKDLQIGKNLEIPRSKFRSVRFYKHQGNEQEMEGMKYLVKAKVKFQMLFIGSMFRCYNDRFVYRNMKSFEALLELGKDKLKHLVVQSLNFPINLPLVMPALKKITFRGGSGNSYFKDSEDLSARFPNVDTIAFMDLWSHNWSESERWWLPGGMFYSKKFCGSIRFLKSSEKLKPNIEEKLMEKFVGAECVEIITEDRYGDDTIVDGIISA